MNLYERVEIINRINEAKGMLVIIQNYMNTFYKDDEAVKLIFQTIDSELTEAELMAVGQYGHWESIESLLEKERSYALTAL